jgi:hypothetical protein
LHWAYIESLALDFIGKREEWFEGITVEIVSQGKLTNIQMLSDTNWETIQKIIDGKITTEIEWKKEAEIIN